MKRFESDRYGHAVRLGLSVAALSCLSACGLLENRADATQCPTDQEESLLISERFLSFDKTKTATLRCSDGKVLLRVSDVTSDRTMLEVLTEFTSLDGLHAYWSIDGKKIWVSAPTQSSILLTYELPA